MYTQVRIIVAVLLSGRLSVAFAQSPIVSSVLNAASLVTPPTIGHALAPGSLASIFGQHLAASTVTGSAPYSTSLGGTSITVGGIPAPLLYISPTQINFQVPAEVVLQVEGGSYTEAPLVVSTGGGGSAPFNVDLYYNGPGIFTLDGTGCGSAAILNVRPDGSVSLNSPTNSAAPGDYLEIFGTGLGPTASSTPDGVPSLGPDTVTTPAGAIVGAISTPLVMYSGAQYAGRAPGLVGVDQVNVQVPQGVEEACSVPLQTLEDLLVPSQIVPVSIHTGAGACVDPPQQSSGQISLQRTIFPNSEQPEMDTLTASFSAFPAGTAAVLAAPPAPGCYIGGPVYHQPPNSPCGTPGIQPLNVGAVSVQSQGFGPILATTATNNGGLIYTATLPPASIQQGSYAVNVGGTGSVGAFQTGILTGSPIQITSQFPGGATLALNQLAVNWTGGNGSEVVIMRLVHPGQIWDTQLVCAASGSAHSVVYGLYVPGQFGQPVLYYPQATGDLEIIVDVVPASALAAIPAPGLSNGFTQTWMYEYRFTGLQVY
jgi:uncharacterized protein (TIGR03437 family)